MHDRSTPFEATIKWTRKETRDTFTCAIRISNRDIQRGYRFVPGQFNMLYVPGIGEAPISMSSSPLDRDIMHTVRIAGDVTTALSLLGAGEVIGIRGPFGRGWPIEEAEDLDLLIVAGGLGIAPLRSVARHFMKTHSPKKKTAHPRRMLLYGAKTPKDIVFRDEFPRFRDIFDVFLSVDRADPEEYWRGETGLVTQLFDRLSLDPVRTIVFMCGPEIMMQTSVRELILREVPEEKIFVSMERNMNCGMGICGHCFFGPKFVCKDGPVFRFSEISGLMGIKEL
ncbi:MAG: FAD/NAD(P)-binding protein [Nitrospiraceae bacterium]|nr:FAD/NAD(P)-binding protein [Nitrospiraceae bacterium]